MSHPAVIGPEIALLPVRFMFGLSMLSSGEPVLPAAPAEAAKSSEIILAESLALVLRRSLSRRKLHHRSLRATCDYRGQQQQTRLGCRFFIRHSSTKVKQFSACNTRSPEHS
jgi:hypothetical protein